MVDPIAPAAPGRLYKSGFGRATLTASTPRIGYRPLIPVVYPDGHHDQLLVVEAVTERPLGEIRQAAVDKPTWVHNGIGSLGFTTSAYNDALDHLVDQRTVVNGAGEAKLLGRELQWYRDGVLRWAGPPLTLAPNLNGTVSVSAFDLGWYLTRRVTGAAERNDLFGGIGSMDRRGLPGWTQRGSAVKSRDTVDRVRGLASMKVAGSGAVTATYHHPPTRLSTTIPVHITAVVKLPASIPTGGRILSIDIRATPGGRIIDSADCTVLDETPTGTWFRISTYANLPPAGGYVTGTLWSLSGSPIGFDDVRLLKNDTTGIPAPGADLATHALALLNHWQTARGQGTFGLRGRIITNTGTVEVLGERHLSHVQAVDALARYVGRDDGFDWWIDPATREFRVAARRGVDHVNVTLHRRSVAYGGWTHDESMRASKEIVLGEGDGVDRPEGGYLDTSRTAGLVLDDVYQPPDGTPLSALDPMARQRHAQLSQPQITPDALAISEDLLGTVNPGDGLTSNLAIGKFRLPTDQPLTVGTLALNIQTGQLELAA